MAGSLEADRLVFLRTRWTPTPRWPLCSLIAVRERASFEVPKNGGANVTLLASMSAEGMGPCLAVEGSTTKAVFETCLERVSAPTLRPGLVVVIDNH